MSNPDTSHDSVPQTLYVPGAVYYDALCPTATTMQAELGLPLPAITKRGKGVRVTYSNATTLAIRDTLEYLEERAEMMLGNVEPEERRVYRAMLKTVERARRECKNV